MTPEEKYKEVEKMFRRLSSEMSHVVQSFYLWRALVLARSIPEFGEEQAKKNAEIMNFHRNFFVQTEDSHLATFVIGITKFYDRDQRALTLDAIIEKMREYQDDVAAETLISIYPDRFDRGELKSNYKPFDKDDLAKIDALRKENEHVLKNLRTIRNKKMAHTDIEVIEVKFVPNEVEKLIKDTQKIFNELQGRFGRATTKWDQLKEAAEQDTNLLLENLHRGEAQRKEEIRRKWESKNKK